MSPTAEIQKASLKEFETRKWSHASLKGFSQEQLDQHYELYEAYVKNANSLLEKISGFEGEEITPEQSELRRRFSFEYDGMRMHEIYFDNLAPNKKLNEQSELRQAFNQFWGSFENWSQDFQHTGQIRGNGWVCLYREPNGNLYNAWIGDHEVGHLVGCTILLAMDVWEHAYAVDFSPTGRPDYIKAFFENICWDTVQSRFAK